MLVKEFRVPLPISVEEYQVAQLYAVAEASKNETGGGDGIEVLKNEPYDDPSLPGGKGQYTHKIYHLASKVPRFIKAIAPKGSLEIHEKAWNAYPYCKTVLSNPDYMKDNFSLTIETWHKPGQPTIDNVHQLPLDQWKKVEVVQIDIVNDPVERKDYKESEDPALFKSTKTGRGQLAANWKSTAEPLMTAYKLVSMEFKWWGLQSRVESMTMKTERKIFHNFHRQLFCWMDHWYGLTMADIRALEDKTKHDLDEARQHGEVKGTAMHDE
ncbi:phosphatidylinositol transfer protein/retinal degeneration b protein [Capsaspora owczarzaki ATCC 30864]|uniref:Phosphatidylinositol transfer protein/retinal degeneration b protein n=1 Tax=Capsaspora owczarzaki (strain ATCC 30864) TaxID=595528 RepID=A0A0D2VVB9_CAPO3|nr:phosphatidylinositol transfer protein/retinal degeneration b protein [Capsaspora owczarzaki ATCC 30864]KJE95412.1 phosphatidylinositol transfer protein/retinal degeneration b protein [Capsaspora owczarzaki ATCC 30864]|eukprot:XP_004345456.1 phosphatidylinositol transfer protein/retinal degeneration b protein [Capsaspora owczarzaki ATCC 30864]